MDGAINSETLSNREWSEWLRTDTDKAFRRLVEQYRNELFDLCARISGNRSEADDLVQETFIRAYGNLKSFRGDSHPRTWLYRIAINLSISFTRRLKRWRMKRGDEDELFPEIASLSNPSPEIDVENRNLAMMAHKAVEKLPIRQRTAVILVIIRELSYSEAAEIMGLSVGGVKANVHHGLKKLRMHIKEISG